MSKKSNKNNSGGHGPSITKKAYKNSLHQLQIELVKLQRHLIKCDDKIVIILEGRDAAGKDGAIKRIVQYLSPRETRVVALGKPSDRERTSWYFQRYVPYLPAARELVLFNHSWYNRAGVERVMGFCTEAEHEESMGSVSDFENMLVRSGIKFLKYYLDIGKAEQKQRLDDRKTDSLKQWKIKPCRRPGAEVLEILQRGPQRDAGAHPPPMAPWTLVRANDKRLARLKSLKTCSAACITRTRMSG